MSELLSALNPHQSAAVVHPAGPALVLAGAGSGKTRVLTTRVAWLMEEAGVKPESILLVTFTNKAAHEMRERVAAQTGQELPFSGTFHSIGARILRRHGHLIGLNNNFVIYDSDDQLSLIKDIYKSHQIDPKLYNPNAVRNQISNAKSELISAHKYQEFAKGAFQETSARVYQIYQRNLKENQAVDFDDLLVHLVTLLKTQDHLRGRLQGQLEHILIDEYQDTNTAQYALTRLLCSPQDNFFVVGDFSQSIYAWRGADYRNMLKLKTDYPAVTEYRLEQNYRSTQNILDAATHIIAKNDDHPVLELWTDQPASEPIRVLTHQTGDDEARNILQLIQTDLSSYNLSDVVILYRTNAQSRPFEEACLKAGVSYQIVGGFKFYERKEIKDLLAYLRLVTNPKDTVSQNRALKLGKRIFAKFSAWKETLPEELPEPASLIQKILDVTKFLDRFDQRDPDDLSRLENIQELINVAAQFTNVDSFLENVALVQDTYLVDAVTKEATQSLTLMSLHSAKGLEFPVVFMVGMEEGLLPHSRSLLDAAQLSEERRLCYVGITRAKEKLFLSHAHERWQYGSKSYTTPSRFLADLPEEILETHDLTNSYHSQPAWQRGKARPHAYQPSPASNERRVVIDDDTLDGVLSGEIDLDQFLDR